MHLKEGVETWKGVAKEKWVTKFLETKGGEATAESKSTKIISILRFSSSLLSSPLLFSIFRINITRTW